MQRDKVVRGLRIAISAVSLVGCVVAAAYWVRSYYWNDAYAIHLGVKEYFVQSVMGRVWFVRAQKTASFHQRITHHRQLGEHVRRDENVFGYYFRRPYPAGTDYAVRIPHWWLVLVIAGIAAFPWIHWSKHFSLRTLLIATTAVAVILGLIVYATR